MINMKKSSKIAVVAGLGAIAGGVAGYYLNSDKGREQLKTASETIKEKSAKAASMAGDFATKAKGAAYDIASKAQQAMTTATHKAEQVKEDVATGVGQMKERAERTSNGGYPNVNA
jgi:hypothetical protein